MKLKVVGSNMTEVEAGNALVLFSYSTPVAARYMNPAGETEYIKTSKKWSATTSRHINKWLDGVAAREVSQDFMDALA